jgi:hypothetical protein
MKQSLEKEVLNLQASLDHERSSRNHALTAKRKQALSDNNLYKINVNL